MDENRTDAREGQLFHTALRGFARRDVVDYIARLTAQHRQETEDAALRIRALEENLNDLQSLLDAEKETCAALREKLAQAQAQRDDAQQALTQQGVNERAHVEAASALARRESGEKEAQIARLNAALETQKQLAAAMEAQQAILAQRAQAAELAARYYSQLQAAPPAEEEAEKPAEAPKAKPEAEEKPAPRKPAAETGKSASGTRAQEAKSALSVLLSMLRND